MYVGHGGGKSGGQALRARDLSSLDAGRGLRFIRCGVSGELWRGGLESFSSRVSKKLDVQGRQEIHM